MIQSLKRTCLLIALCLATGSMFAQYEPATAPETMYDNLMPSSCSFNDVGTDTRDGNSGLGYGYGSPHYANYLNVTVNSCIGSMGTPGFYWKSSHGTNGSDSLPVDAQDPDVVLVSPGGDALPSDIDDVWAIAVYYSASNGGYCMSVAEFIPGVWTFTPLSPPILIHPFVPAGYEPHINIDSDHFGRYAVVMQENGGIVSKTQTLFSVPTVPTNAAFQPGLIEPDIACLHNSAYQSNIVALTESRNKYRAYTREYLGTIWSPYFSPVMPELYEPRIAAPSSGLLNEYAVTVGRKYPVGPDVHFDIIFQVDEGPISYANTGAAGFPPAINVNNSNVLPCITYTYHWSGGSLLEQISLGWHVEAIDGVLPLPNQPRTFVGLDIAPTSPYSPTTPTEYLDISNLNGENNESVMAISGRYTTWAKSAAFTYENNYVGFGEYLMWKIQSAGAPSWKTAPSAELEADLKNDLQLYPNPADDLVHLKIDRGADGYRIEVTNQLGQVVLRQSTSADVTALSVADLPAGLYTVKLTDPETQVSHHAKFVRR